MTNVRNQNSCGIMCLRLQILFRNISSTKKACRDGGSELDDLLYSLCFVVFVFNPQNTHLKFNILLCGKNAHINSDLYA